MYSVSRKGLPQITHVAGYSVSKDFTSENTVWTFIYTLEQDTGKKGSHACVQQHFYVQTNPGKLSASRLFLKIEGTQRILTYGQLQTDQGKISHSEAWSLLLGKCSSSEFSAMAENILHTYSPSLLYYGLSC